ncbi:succinate dehydrogenase flavoprotein subunit [Neptunomonas phycophila]|jgi:succinate dehydrogenase / fumarate reductase flavoprotein subunit|uniref:Succinate dehydrogenase flavoprotein subunit n=1 Tax=Neptunomonas phycophila TaxID=1572645 RepID=A0AAW7XKV7_9GAMM|nr:MULTISPECIES: succinate dehydrogenase flavoprotein subunit [Neptunomonas]MBT3147405.1 succinate dehydrogenase flavoprotein subunit [Neptunomonas phycophila]MDN2660421.1 succinate dehydrogenase flavoprotein subunit [Neptunomonas sp. CHC150]MDO6453993.1 succinate dehydrogenase flavoprotein subunit [Neptunomonas phycophila]MDO6469518.1 succinate dehydrogenase flavoprotein subunit [Neptunomonas phycophila]MDP2523792.1 succinate dehydrogenase flavoprotein subunit [Neptunomonas phycophila]
MSSLRTLTFDAIVVGGGGAGMRAALQLAQSGLKTACVTKVFPTRSHTVSAQGGITCAIASADPNDDWRWHMYDTVKGSDYIGDQDAIEYMCSVGPQAVFELDHMGMPFSRTEIGRIYQRPFGGQSKGPDNPTQAARTCAAADRTGHALLHTLYQANMKAGTTFLNEWYAVDLVKNEDGAIVGCVAICIETGETVYIKAKATVLATGGAGRIYSSTTNALINTGDGMGMAMRAGIPAQDMEMWQFHPTGIYGAGTLVTEGCRGEGGYLINKDGERFMERYAPNAKDLAGRDVVARSMILEILEGRGCGPDGDHVYLKLDHLGEEVLHSRLPGICELSKTFAHADPVKEPVPVVPTCHYMMGGVATNVGGQAIAPDKDGNDTIVEGLFACGEVACVSVHGANRLGGNSLLDLVVFGRAAGIQIEKQMREGYQVKDATEADIERAMARLNRLNSSTGGERVADVRKELQATMQLYFGVFRDGESMQKGLELLKGIREKINNLHLEDKSQSFNTARIEALELENLMEVAEATAVAAEVRKESRGAHARNDFTERDDENWLCHSVYFPIDKTVGKRAVNFAPKTVPAFPPKVRTY